MRGDLKEACLTTTCRSGCSACGIAGLIPGTQALQTNAALWQVCWSQPLRGKPSQRPGRPRTQMTGAAPAAVAPLGRRAIGIGLRQTSRSSLMLPDQKTRACQAYGARLLDCGATRYQVRGRHRFRAVHSLRIAAGTPHSCRPPPHLQPPRPLRIGRRRRRGKPLQTLLHLRKGGAPRRGSRMRQSSHMLLKLHRGLAAQLALKVHRIAKPAALEAGMVTSDPPRLSQRRSLRSTAWVSRS